MTHLSELSAWVTKVESSFPSASSTLVKSSPMSINSPRISRRQMFECRTSRNRVWKMQVQARCCWLPPEPYRPPGPAWGCCSPRQCPRAPHRDFRWAENGGEGYKNPTHPTPWFYSCTQPWSGCWAYTVQRDLEVHAVTKELGRGGSAAKGGLCSQELSRKHSLHVQRVACSCSGVTVTREG